MLKSWKITEIASGNTSLEYLYDEDKSSFLYNTLKTYYKDRMVDDLHFSLIAFNEFYQDIYIDGIKFNIGHDEYGTSIIPYENNGNKYIEEIFKIVIKLDK